MSLPGILTACYDDRAHAARAWKARGGKVIGIFADDVPTALIEAAGCLAVRISGDPEGGQPEAMARGPIDVRADRLEFVNSWVHLIDAGRYAFVDRFIVSNSRKYVLQLAERLRALPNPLGFHILDRALGEEPRARTYNRAQLAKLRAALGEISDDALAEAVARYNRRAALLVELAALRRDARVSGSDAIRALIAIRTMHTSDAIPALEALIASAGAPLRAKRLFLTGSPQDHDRVYRAAEAEGVVIVSESHGWSARLLEQPIADIADHYAASADFIVPLAASVATVAERCRASGAEAVLSHVQAYDEASLWEAPSEIAACGLPAITLAEQPYRSNPAAIRKALAT